MMDKNANRIITLISYVIGSELLWRAFNAGIYWEYGKIFSIVLLIFIGLRIGSNIRSNQKLGIVYVLLLLPSILVVESISQSDLTHALLLGPILLGISVTVFSGLEINSKIFKNMLIYGIMPVISFLIITAWRIQLQKVVLILNLHTYIELKREVLDQTRQVTY